MKWVEVSAVLGVEEIPLSAAFVIKKAIDLAIKNGEITQLNKWQIVEYWAADYLSGE